MPPNTREPDPRQPARDGEGIFRTHNCWRCKDGQLPCVNWKVKHCEYPQARND